MTRRAPAAPGVTHRDLGATATELALLAPVILLVMAVMVGGARVWLARAAVADAAQSAARAASLEYSAGPAGAQGRAIGLAALTDVPCARRAVAIDAAGFGVAVGMPATVSAQVTCVVELGDLVGFGLPGTITVQADGHAALDTYRRRR